MRSIRPFTIAISAAALVVMSACGSSTTTPSASPSASASASASPTAAAPTGPATVMVSTTSLGPVLTDERGFALYKFDPDDKTPGISVCYEVRNCAVNWPPLLTKGSPTAGTGATAAMLGTTTRKDGNIQVTYNKIPLYFYAKDKAPGDVNGQAVGTVWWLLAAAGTPVKTTKSSTTGSPTTGASPTTG